MTKRDEPRTLLERARDAVDEFETDFHEWADFDEKYGGAYTISVDRFEAAMRRLRLKLVK